METMLRSSSLPIPGISRGDDTREKLTWTLAGFNISRRGWHPAGHVTCTFDGHVIRKAELVKTGLSMLPERVCFGVPVVLDAWKALCNMITRNAIPHTVALLHGWLHYKELCSTEVNHTDWVWFRRPEELDVNSVMGDFLYGVSRILNAFGIASDEEVPISVTPTSMREKNMHTITRFYARDHLLEATWAEGLHLKVGGGCSIALHRNVRAGGGTVARGTLT